MTPETRVFDAPRRLVFEAMTNCDHLKHWWGPRKLTVASCSMDFRPGGRYRIVQREANGQEYGFRGEYREIVPPERIVQTFEFEGMLGHVSVETLTLVEEDGKTIYTSTSVFDSVEDRDGMLQSGWKKGRRRHSIVLPNTSKRFPDRMSIWPGLVRRRGVESGEGEWGANDPLPTPLTPLDSVMALLDFVL